MPTLTYPYTFVNGTVADATQVDANFNAVGTIINGLDYANIGGAGIYASQIIPTAVGFAQFGGSFGYTFQPNNAGQCPLTLRGTSGQTADLFDVFGASNKLAWVDASGNFTANTLRSVSTASANLLYAQPSADGSLGVLNVTNAAGSQSILRLDSIDAADSILGVARGGHLGLLIPALLNTGLQVANTVHCVVGTVTAAGASTSVSLAGAAAFTAGQAWLYLVMDASAGTIVTAMSGLSNTGFTFASTSGHVYMYFAIGW